MLWSTAVAVPRAVSPGRVVSRGFRKNLAAQNSSVRGAELMPWDLWIKVTAVSVQRGWRCAIEPVPLALAREGTIATMQSEARAPWALLQP